MLPHHRHLTQFLFQPSYQIQKELTKIVIKYLLTCYMCMLLYGNRLNENGSLEAWVNQIYYTFAI